MDIQTPILEISWPMFGCHLMKLYKEGVSHVLPMSTKSILDFQSFNRLPRADTGPDQGRS